MPTTYLNEPRNDGDPVIRRSDLLSAPIVTPEPTDYALISDVSDAGKPKRVLVSDLGNDGGGSGGLSPSTLDANTSIIEAQRKAGAFPKLDATKSKFAWSDWQALILYTSPSGALYGFGGAAYGYFS